MHYLVIPAPKVLTYNYTKAKGKDFWLECQICQKLKKIRKLVSKPILSWSYFALFACEHTRHIYKVIILQGRQRAKKENDPPLTSLVCHTRFCPSFAKGGEEQMLCATCCSGQNSRSEQKAVLGIIFLDPAVTFFAFILYQAKWACEVSHCLLKEKQKESLRSLNSIPVMIWWPRCFNFTWLWDIQVPPLQKRCALLQVNFETIIAFLSHLHKVFLQELSLLLRFHYTELVLLIWLLNKTKQFIRENYS